MVVITRARLDVATKTFIAIVSTSIIRSVDEESTVCSLLSRVRRNANIFWE